MLRYLELVAQPCGVGYHRLPQFTGGTWRVELDVEFDVMPNPSGYAEAPLHINTAVYLKTNGRTQTSCSPWKTQDAQDSGGGMPHQQPAPLP